MDLSSELAAILGKKTVEALFDKINAIKKKGEKDEIINNLEEIINELISDKNRLIQISQAYEEKLIAQKITTKEINYITESIIPLLEKLVDESDSEASEKIQKGINMLKPILSKETFNILQILGFNFKKALGEPLTELIESLIKSKVYNDRNYDLQLLNLQREIEFLKVCQDEVAYNRLVSLKQNNS